MSYRITHIADRENPHSLVNASIGKKDHTNENFPVGSFLIRSDLRPAIHTFYKFARGADNISDDPLKEPRDKIKELLEYRAILLGKEGDQYHPATQMRLSLEKTKVTPQHCLDLLRAFECDATVLRYQGWDDLMKYCRYSASPVGRYVLDLHNIGQHTWPANDALCTVLQVLNHMQDCADDYRELDRVYIPLDFLTASGAVTAELSKPSQSEELKRTFQLMLDRLDELMNLARHFPNQLTDRRLKTETSIIVALADAMILRLRTHDPLLENTKLTTSETFRSIVVGVTRVLW